jgi:hypothetical protein
MTTGSLAFAGLAQTLAAGGSNARARRVQRGRPQRWRPHFVKAAKKNCAGCFAQA